MIMIFSKIKLLAVKMGIVNVIYIDFLIKCLILLIYIMQISLFSLSKDDQMPMELIVYRWGCILNKL